MLDKGKKMWYCLCITMKKATNTETLGAIAEHLNSLLEEGAVVEVDGYGFRDVEKMYAFNGTKHIVISGSLEGLPTNEGVTEKHSMDIIGIGYQSKYSWMRNTLFYTPISPWSSDISATIHKDGSVSIKHCKRTVAHIKVLCKK